MLVEYALARHYPALHGSPTPALALLAAVREARRARGAVDAGGVHSRGHEYR